MEITLDQTGGILLVRRVGESSVTLLDRELQTSFVLAPDSLSESWPVTDSRSLSVGDVEPILALQPEVVLLGTGSRQVFPPADFLAGFLRKSVGIEVMDNGAAARTYNLLASDGRRVVAAFILPNN